MQKLVAIAVFLFGLPTFGSVELGVYPLGAWKLRLSHAIVTMDGIATPSDLQIHFSVVGVENDYQVRDVYLFQLPENDMPKVFSLTDEVKSGLTTLLQDALDAVVMNIGRRSPWIVNPEYFGRHSLVFLKQEYTLFKGPNALVVGKLEGLEFSGRGDEIQTANGHFQEPDKAGVENTNPAWHARYSLNLVEPRINVFNTLVNTEVSGYGRFGDIANVFGPLDPSVERRARMKERQAEIDRRFRQNSELFYSCKAIIASMWRPVGDFFTGILYRMVGYGPLR